MKIARVEATPLAIPLAQEFHWAGGAQVGANLVLFAVHTDDGVVGYGESICEDPRAVVAHGELMARQVVGHAPGDMEAILRSIWGEGRWKMWPQFTQIVFAGIEVACWDALGRALGVPTRTFFGGAVHDELDYFGFLQGDDPETLAAHARQLAGEGYRVIYLKVGRGTGARRGVRRGGARGDRARSRCCGSTRTRRGTSRPRSTASGGSSSTTSTGSSSRRRRRTSPGSRGCAARSTRRSPPTRPCSRPASCARCSRREAADVIVQGSHDAGGLYRFKQQAFLCEAHGLRVNRHAFMESELSFHANAQVASTIPNLTLGNQVMHQLLAERLTLGPAPGARRRPLPPRRRARPRLRARPRRGRARARALAARRRLQHDRVRQVNGAETIVIGGGILGATTLWELAREDMAPLLLEAGRSARPRRASPPRSCAATTRTPRSCAWPSTRASGCASCRCTSTATRSTRAAAGCSSSTPSRRSPRRENSIDAGGGGRRQRRGRRPARVPARRRGGRDRVRALRAGLGLRRPGRDDASPTSRRAARGRPGARGHAGRRRSRSRAAACAACASATR